MAYYSFYDTDIMLKFCLPYCCSQAAHEKKNTTLTKNKPNKI